MIEFQENLQLSFEQQIVISQPDVISLPIKSDVEFLVLASDGVWEVMNNQEVCEFISSRLKNGMELVEICEELVEFCSKRDEVEPGKLRWTVEYNFGTFDNVTVVIVALK